MNYHIEHHMFPMVPFHALPKLHERVRRDLPYTYSGLIDAFREIVPVLIRQSKDASYFMLRELPGGGSEHLSTTVSSDVPASAVTQGEAHG
jgi:fatty acid desaturase